MRAFTIRKAGEADLPALKLMQDRSMRALGAAFYDAATLAAFIDAFGTMDFSVVAEGHYFVATDRAGAVLGCGGWSRQMPGYQRDVKPVPVDPRAATVRGVFTDPAFARQGIGRAIMRQVELDAARHGIMRLDLTATLPGVALYEALGYATVERRSIDLGNGLSFGCADMVRSLAAFAAAA